MNYTGALKLLENDTISGLYILSGDEVFLIDTFIELFKEKILTKEFFDMNYTEFEFSKLDIQELKLSCKTAPFFNKKRLIIVKDVDLSKEGISNNKDFFENMYEYIEKIPTTTLLIFTFKENPFKGKFYKKIQSLGHNIELICFTQIELFKFIKKRFNLKNIKIKDSNINYIIDKIGYLDKSRNKNLYDVENEVKKILNQDKKEIEIKDIDEILIDKFENNIFKLLDFISIKDYKNSIITLVNLKKSNEDSFLIFYMIVRYVRNLLYIKTLRQRQKTIEEITKEIKISNYECKKLYKTTDSFTLQTLIEYINLLYETEVKLKSTTKDIDILLELLITKMIKKHN